MPRKPKTLKVACGLRSAFRSKQNWSASSWYDLACLVPPHVTLVALDSQYRPNLGPGERGEYELLFYAHLRVKDLTGQTQGILQAAALVERCDAFIGVDSSLMHIAAALGKAVVCLCAAAPLAARIPLCGKRVGFQGQGCRCEQQPNTCLDPSQHCLRGYTAQEVWAALQEVVK